ncbi:ATPase family protein associated with various cellular activities (AAA) [Neolewinella xylanilytica]|uniref:ATPase family protein associated with various cellular activities (AAA) n=1 Tax=Neolewinella xylanilytica TaxID=1514080 RepID=A0A2S6I996_9BACT|nr:ATP-binding protein [Neolewinella xylanilytica]PPK88065.1 ATPase family protein associated with various cellular activities (AAA) [Neolewinella xylanilytica]
MGKSTDHAQAIDRELDWLSQRIEWRFAVHFRGEPTAAPAPPKLIHPDAAYTGAVRRLEASLRETARRSDLGEKLTDHRLLIALALCPHLRPAALDIFFTKNELFDRGFTEFGGLTSGQHGGFLPSGETAAFLLAGTDTAKRLAVTEYLREDGVLSQRNLLRLQAVQRPEPALSGALLLSDEALTRLTTDRPFAPTYSTQFPAEPLHTSLTWDDMVLSAQLQEEIGDLCLWINHEGTILGEWDLKWLLKPGYRALFYGPPGTGKTLCASLLGKEVDRPVYRIDLSQVVSKYIGETEKNLSALFAMAEHRDWILFFDEADALFGKRSPARHAQDRYANQETSYLLQRIEGYAGMVILATNQIRNLDEAFTRRFQSIIHFPVPDVEQRISLWEKAFGDKLPLGEDVDFAALGKTYELTGGSIVNILRYCSMLAFRRSEPCIHQRDIVYAIRREYRKEGKTI